MNTAAEYLQNGGTAAAHGSIDHIGPNPLVQGRLTNLRCGPAFLATRRCGARAPQNAVGFGRGGRHNGVEMVCVGGG